MKVSFCANLKINPNLYERIPPNAPLGYPNCVIDEYKKYLDIPVVKKLTEDDTIELTRVKYGAKGYGVKMDFICPSNPDATYYGAGCYSSKNEVSVSAAELFRQTLQFICSKYDINQNRREKSSERLVRIVKTLQKRKEQSGAGG